MISPLRLRVYLLLQCGFTVCVCLVAGWRELCDAKAYCVCEDGAVYYLWH